ncbi:hypothetical protein [Stappia stellulata]|uniref:hypothetical protein n=1 Tax=Stappia stellulata TaxID=71235 RepID=UPI0012EBA57D|nr:hypothetical protein [Stappia stellulata]
MVTVGARAGVPRHGQIGANAVTLWHGRRTAGEVVPVTGLGTLLADVAQAR